MTVSNSNLAEQANQTELGCTLNHALLQQQLTAFCPSVDLYPLLFEQRPHLCAELPVFIGNPQWQQQRQLIQAIEQVIALPAYQQQVLTHAPNTAQFCPTASGVCLGFDFHIAADHSCLIEINSNAGGSLLNILLAQAHQDQDPVAVQSALQQFFDMFSQEWRLQNPERALRTVAIVDEQPQQQYLYPEFLLFQSLFQQHGINAIICDPSQLDYHHNQLYNGEMVIDLVYNRLTDFALQHPQHQALQQAYLTGNTVITPHPHNHALYADKRNLVLLSDAKRLAYLNIAPETQATLLQGIAKTLLVKEQDPNWLWQQRKHWFFKPACGYGSKAAYRGDKLTQRVFAEILASDDYVAQALTPPSTRQVMVDNHPVSLKLDLRHYVYQSHSLWQCARLYQGQTTNFRTAGGGFAPIRLLADC